MNRHVLVAIGLVLTSAFAWSAGAGPAEAQSDVAGDHDFGHP